MIFRRVPPTEPGLYWWIRVISGAVPTTPEVMDVYIYKHTLAAEHLLWNGARPITKLGGLWGDRIDVPTVEVKDAV